MGAITHLAPIRRACALFTNVVADCGFGRKYIAATLTDDRVGGNLAIAGDDDRSRFLTGRKAAGIDCIAVHFAIGDDGTVAVDGVYPDHAGPIAVIIEEVDRGTAMRIVTFPSRGVHDAIVDYGD